MLPPSLGATVGRPGPWVSETDALPSRMWSVECGMGNEAGGRLVPWLFNSALPTQHSALKMVAREGFAPLLNEEGRIQSAEWPKRAPPVPFALHSSFFTLH